MSETEEKLIKFSIKDPEFNLDTYIGRVKHFFGITNPLYLLFNIYIYICI